MNVTFIGLGIMGSRMATNLLQSGTSLTVYNRSVEPLHILEERGAMVQQNISEAVADADLVISMLSKPEVVEQLFFGHTGALSAMQKDAIWVDCSTNNPSFSRRAAQEATQHSVQYADAPVAGSAPQAEAAQLAFFVGATKDLFEQITPFLQPMGAKVLHLGEVGMGSSFKMLVNAMLAQSMILFSESLLLGEKLGIDKEFLLKAMPGLPVVAPFTQFKVEMIRKDDYPVQFPLELMHKDLHLAALTAYEAGQPLYLANMAKELYASANQAGLGRADFAAIHQYLSQGQATS
ncbi:MAG: NAD(P)-dependent oxidoreductase [Bacteroidota bacterium]